MKKIRKIFLKNTKMKNFYHNLYTIHSYTVFIVRKGNKKPERGLYYVRV